MKQYNNNAPSSLEAAFPKDFRKEDIQKVLSFVTTGKVCQLISIPGGGKASLIRLLATNRELRIFHLGEKERSTLFIYLNLLEITNLEEVQIKKFLLLSLNQKAKVSNDPLLLTKQLTSALTDKFSQNITVVFLFDHFDEFQNELPRSFFQMLKNFKQIGRYRFAVVFATRRDLKELVDPEILRDFYDFFTGNAIYLKIYNKEAVDYLFAQIEKVFEKRIEDAPRKNIILMTAGHAKLTRIITEIVLRENIPPKQDKLLLKPIAQATLFELWLYLTPEEQQILTAVAKDEKPQQSQALENLVNFDILKEDNSFTIPIFLAFVQKIIPTLASQKITFDQTTREIMKGTNVISDLLSPQEYRLLKFLAENEGRIVNRSELISAVWPDAKAQEGISDEAIDQMVFRLRKKIEEEPTNPKHVITVKGQGLRFLA